MKKQNGGEFASGPVLTIDELSMVNRPKGTQKADSKEIFIFPQKISKNYCTIKNNAYLCNESNDDSTDAAGSANTKQDRQ